MYSVTVNGRLLRYGIRAANGEVIDPSLALVLSDEVLACIIADMADAEYIDVHRPLSRELLSRLREIAMEASAPTRLHAGAPITIVRVSQVVPALSSGAGYAGAMPTLEIVCDHVSHDGLRVSRYSSTVARPTAEERLESVVLTICRTTEPSPQSASRLRQASSAPR